MGLDTTIGGHKYKDLEDVQMVGYKKKNKNGSHGWGWYGEDPDEEMAAIHAEVDKMKQGFDQMNGNNYQATVDVGGGQDGSKKVAPIAVGTGSSKHRHGYGKTRHSTYCWGVWFWYGSTTFLFCYRAWSK